MEQADNIKKAWHRELSHSGGRVTQPREAIVDVIISSARPLTPQEVHEQAKEMAPGIGLVTVYRTIEKLERLGLVDRVHHAENCQTVFRTAVKHAHLLICTKCRQSVYFEGLDIEKELKQAAIDHNYRLTGHWLQLEGICPDCQRKDME